MGRISFHLVLRFTVPDVTSSVITLFLDTHHSLSLSEGDDFTFSFIIRFSPKTENLYINDEFMMCLVQNNEKTKHLRENSNVYPVKKLFKNYMLTCTSSLYLK